MLVAMVSPVLSRRPVNLPPFSAALGVTIRRSGLAPTPQPILTPSLGAGLSRVSWGGASHFVS